VLIAVVLRYTTTGIVLHAAGAEPRALDKSSVSVSRVRYLGVIFVGFMSALAGAFLSIGDIHTFTERMTRGAGYLAIAAVIFGKWTLRHRLGRRLGSPAAQGEPCSIAEDHRVGHRRLPSRRPIA
jgi:ABC-type uncharacterized transport system permease subunit